MESIETPLMEEAVNEAELGRRRYGSALCGVVLCVVNGNGNG